MDDLAEPAAAAAAQTRTGPFTLPVSILATSSYIPASRMRANAIAREQVAPPADAAGFMMQAVYAGTLGWRRAGHTYARVSRASRSTRALHPTPIIAVERLLEPSDMALLAARKLLAAGPPGGEWRPARIIVCQGSFEHALTRSSACRLHSELRAKGAPLAIGQLQGATFLMALQVAHALIAAEPGLAPVLIVAAERWRPPFSRLPGARTALGDGAAAALVGHATRDSWQVEALTVHTPPASSRPRGCRPDRRDVAALVSVIDETCDRIGIRPSEVDRSLPSGINAGLARDVNRRCNLPDTAATGMQPPDWGYLCTADTPAGLDRLLRSWRPHHGQRVLAWSTGLEGQTACVVLKFAGANP